MPLAPACACEDAASLGRQRRAQLSCAARREQLARVQSPTLPQRRLCWLMRARQYTRRTVTALVGWLVASAYAVTGLHDTEPEPPLSLQCSEAERGADCFRLSVRLTMQVQQNLHDISVPGIHSLRITFVSVTGHGRMAAITTAESKHAFQAFEAWSFFIQPPSCYA